ncbi:MAG: nitroreductase [Actinobacteria bacterium]|nr:nitroreductase [Actinomycetota bacterium]
MGNRCIVSERNTPHSPDEVGLLEGIATTRAIRRYLPEPIPEEHLRDILFAATRAPSGSNRQPFRFMVFTDSEKSREVKSLIARGAQQLWSSKRIADGYEQGSGVQDDSPKARMARTMQQYVDNFASVPVLVLACLERYRAPTPTEGASVYPACQNILLAARALGYGGVLTGFQSYVEQDLRRMLEIPESVFLAATLTLGKPMGNHGPVRRVPMNELVYGDTWGKGASWAIDPVGTATLKGRFT